MELEKRKRVSDGEPADAGKRGKPAAEAPDGVKGAAPPGDDEVEEFFAILKRAHKALKYFQERKVGGRELTEAANPAPPWSPLFLPEDFYGAEKVPEKPYAGLDLNSDPATDVSDSG